MKLRLLRTLLTFATLAILLAGCTGSAVEKPQLGGDEAVGDVDAQSVTGSTGAVGGTIKNSAPTFSAFTPDATTGENRGGFVIVFSGSFKDKNTEQQVRNISVTGVGPSTLGASHTVTSAEKNATVAPGDFGADGFKVWTGTLNDGVLNFEYRQTFPGFTPAGSYSFSAYAVDQANGLGVSTAVPVTLTAFSDITIDPTPVSAAGVALPGQNWGQWDAEAGGQNVVASNYMKLVNTGDIATSRVVIDFGSAFVGAEDPSFSIPTASNVEFAFWRGELPSASAAQWQAANADASFTVEFTQRDQPIYVAYRIVDLPEILPTQAYGISFTVTDLS